MEVLQSTSDNSQIPKEDSFDIWLSERPLWLQTAASLMIETKRMPNSKEIAELAKCCIDEASGITQGYSTVSPGTLETAAKRPELRINSISNIIGVNAIKPGASLSFGKENIAVVYGANGTGKSGFSRLLKQACGSRAKDDLIGHVFSKEEQQSPSATIDITIGNEVQNLIWSRDSGSLAKLRHVHVFDTKTAQMYMGKNEASYEPSHMRFISSLIKVCGQVSSFLDNLQKQKVSKLPTMPTDFETTNAFKWLNSLKKTTKSKSIDDMCLFPKELDDERLSTEKALSEKNVDARLREITKDKLALQRLKSNIDNLQCGLSDDNLQVYLAAQNNAILKRKLATEDAQKVFSDNELDGIGQEAWLSLWRHAKQFSEQSAYPHSTFPYLGNGARCVLCQQEIHQDAKNRLTKFENYVRGGLEADAKKAESKRKELIQKIPVLPAEQDWMVMFSLLKLSDAIVKQYFNNLVTRRKAVESAITINDIPPFDWRLIYDSYKTTLDTLEAEEKTLNQLQKDGQRQKLELRLKELQALQWLSQNKASIVEEKKRLTYISTIKLALKLVSTNTLTKKNNELAQYELDAGYQKRFGSELDKLGGSRLKVKPLCKKEGKGKITFGLALKDSNLEIPAEKILSEGETRIVTLASFLADMTGSDQQSPFIFDDPISSLDQDFEEKVVSRLVELSKERQVIIFTHRLSLLSQVEASVKKLRDQSKEHSLPIPVTVHIETLRKLGNYSGLVAKLSLRDSKPKKAIARIKDEFIPQLRKHIENGNADSFEREAWQLCSEFRILVERCVESILLNEVLVRFRRSVQTQGRLSALTKIQQSDCDLIDDLMTRYSAFEHSQSDQFPAIVPDFEQIEDDVKCLSTWINQF